jgi:hypothetical protein
VSPTVTDGLGADRNDDPSGDLPAPLPLHERDWIHPSELGAITAADRARASDTVKRASALVAVASVVLTLLFIQAVNPSRRPSPRARAFVTEAVSASSASGAERAERAELVGSVATTGAPVVALGDGDVVIAPSGQGEPGNTVSVMFGDMILTTTVLDMTIGPGLQILLIGTVDDRGTRGTPFVPPVAAAAPAPHRGDAVIVHGTNDAVGGATIGIASGTFHPLLPVDPDDDHPDGGGPAFDADGRICGWVVEWNGTHLLIPIAELLAVIPRLASHGQRP